MSRKTVTMIYLSLITYIFSHKHLFLIINICADCHDARLSFDILTSKIASLVGEISACKHKSRKHCYSFASHCMCVTCVAYMYCLRHSIQALLSLSRTAHTSNPTWKRVIFSDETKINRLGSDGHQWIWKKTDDNRLTDRDIQGSVVEAL
jgi:hypothetical protein